MYRILMIMLIIPFMFSAGWCDQTDNGPTIAQYFAQNTLVTAEAIDSLIPAQILAILELTGENVDQAELTTINEQFRIEIEKSEKFEILDREIVATVLAEKELNPDDCNTDSCFAEIGKAFGANLLISGTVSFVESTFIASVKMIDVETAEVVKVSTYDTRDGLDSLLTAGIPAIVAELVSEKEEAEPEPEPDIVEKFPVGTPDEPAIITEDLFATQLTSDIYGFKAKSTKRAFFYSLLIPGAGELYAGSKIKPIVFAGVEALLWTGYFVYKGKGNDKKDEYRAYAEDHYYWWDFMQWWNTLDSTEQDTFSHRLPWDDEYNTAIKNHEYYEDIGKYDQFQLGWDDINDYPPGVPNGVAVLSSHREFYLDLRKESNDYFQSANTMIMLSLGNRIISAFDAALTAKKHNKGQKRYTIKLKTKDFGNGKVPILTYTYRF